MTYSAPNGWKKTTKENTVVFSELKENGVFCAITLYGAPPGTGKPLNDFAGEWNNLVVKPFNAEGPL